MIVLLKVKFKRNFRQSENRLKLTPKKFGYNIIGVCYFFNPDHLVKNETLFYV